MNYKYVEREDFEDFASGRVIIHKSKMPNFPVRLTSEIFLRCLEYSAKKENLVIYDPCCGGGYLLTVLGYLHSDIIQEIIASDIDEEAIKIAETNLSLLTVEGLNQRIEHLETLYKSMNKESHQEALQSAKRFLNQIKKQTHVIKSHCFKQDILKPIEKSVKPDLIIVDVPYGNLAEWSSKDDSVNKMLNELLRVASESTIISVITDKSQKINHDGFRRLEKFKVGKRVIYIMKRHGEEL